MKIVVTGTSGFVGSQLLAQLPAEYIAFPLYREQTKDTVNNKKKLFEFENADALVHLAGRAHVLNDTASDIFQAYASVNIDYSILVAEFAKIHNIKRFIFLSSVKVNGEETIIPFNEISPTIPLDNYGKTKQLAENTLIEYCKKNQIELVIIRPPLIYGPLVKANFKQLIKLCKLPLPLPFGAINNKRSFIYIENLIDFILLCCKHPSAKNQTFLISDDFDVSTTTLIKTIRQALNKSSFLIPINHKYLSYILKIIGKGALGDRLLGNLQVDITKSKQLLGWQPKVDFNTAIYKTIKGKL